MKYIVKNCPSFGRYVKDGCLYCAHNKDCSIRQIVELCSKYHPVLLSRILQEEILQILQVEEVEE